MIAEPLQPLAVAIDSLTLDPANARRHSPRNVATIEASLRLYGQRKPIVVRRAGMIVEAGNGTVEAARKLGWTHLAAVIVDDDPVTAAAFGLVDNRSSELAEWDDDALSSILSGLHEADLDLDALGWSDDELRDILAPTTPQGEDQAKANATLAERFLVPPFSVLDARQGYWQERKRAWMGLGIESELGRGGPLPATSLGDDGRTTRAAVGASLKTWDGCGRADPVSQRISSVSDAWHSVFDPVLAELVYRWFSPPSGLVLDPFSGGSVRGIVASCVGRAYVGMDVRAEQIEANRAQVDIATGQAPQWIEGDARDVAGLVTGPIDLVFSCPPYADLERYSDDPRDLSTLDYPAFVAAYRGIVRDSVALLAPDRFACFVVGDVRHGHDGAYRGLVADTIRAFEDAGARLYNHAILVTAVASLPLRAARAFVASRKLGTAHQHVLVFVKGDPRKATAACGAIDVVGVDDLARSAGLDPGTGAL